MQDPVMRAVEAVQRASPAVDDRVYHVRQYRPAYFSGFEDGVAKDLKRENLTAPAWFRNFESEDFDRWQVEPYGSPSPELIISAFYKNGERWVAGFACDVTDPFAQNWRYGGKQMERL